MSTRATLATRRPKRPRRTASDWKSSSTRRPSTGSFCCHAAGWSHARLPGPRASADSPATTSACPRPWPDSISLLSPVYCCPECHSSSSDLFQFITPSRAVSFQRSAVSQVDWGWRLTAVGHPRRGRATLASISSCYSVVSGQGLAPRVRERGNLPERGRLGAISGALLHGAGRSRDRPLWRRALEQEHGLPRHDLAFGQHAQIPAMPTSRRDPLGQPWHPLAVGDVRARLARL